MPRPNLTLLNIKLSIYYILNKFPNLIKSKFDPKKSKFRKNLKQNLEYFRTR
jgi:hypothetical protein